MVPAQSTAPRVDCPAAPVALRRASARRIAGSQPPRCGPGQAISELEFWACKGSRPCNMHCDLAKVFAVPSDRARAQCHGNLESVCFFPSWFGAIVPLSPSLHSSIPWGGQPHTTQQPRERGQPQPCAPRRRAAPARAQNLGHGWIFICTRASRPARVNLHSSSQRHGPIDNYVQVGGVFMAMP